MSKAEEKAIQYCCTTTIRNSLNDIKRMAQHQYYCEECGSRMDERISVYRESKSGQKWQRKIERLLQKSDQNKKANKWRKIKNPKI